MRIDTFKRFKQFFKDAPHDVLDSYFGICYTFGGELIGPCIWNKQYIADACSRKEELNYRYMLLEDCDGITLALFMPKDEILRLTEKLYNEIISDFKLEIKKVMERLKLEKINDDF